MTPQIDELAHEGVNFRAAFSECPVCVPARRIMMTGRGPYGVHLNVNVDGQPFSEGPKLAEVMTADPFVVYGNDPVGAAVAATTLGGYRHVPVIDESGNLLGMISPPRVFEFMNSRMKP